MMYRILPIILAVALLYPGDTAAQERPWRVPPRDAQDIGIERPDRGDHPTDAARPNRSGRFQGIDIGDRTILIDRRRYPLAGDISDLRVFVNGMPSHISKLPEGAAISYHATAGGRLTAIWFEGDAGE